MSYLLCVYFLMWCFSGRQLGEFRTEQVFSKPEFLDFGNNVHTGTLLTHRKTWERDISKNDYGIIMSVKTFSGHCWTNAWHLGNIKKVRLTFEIFWFAPLISGSLLFLNSIFQISAISMLFVQILLLCSIQKARRYGSRAMSFLAAMPCRNQT